MPIGTRRVHTLNGSVMAQLKGLSSLKNPFPYSLLADLESIGGGFSVQDLHRDIHITFMASVTSICRNNVKKVSRNDFW